MRLTKTKSNMSYQFDDKKHIHSLDGEPLIGTTTAIKNVMPPFLAKWGATCAIDAVKANATKTVIEGIPVFAIEEIELDKAVMAWSKVRDTAAEGGKDLHAQLETYVKNCIKNSNGGPNSVTGSKELTDFAAWAQENVAKFIHSETNVYSKELWLGGQVDVVFERTDGTYCIGDFKSAKTAYMSHFFQDCLYDLQQAENGYFTEKGEKIGEPLDIQEYYVFTFGGGFHPHQYVANEKIRDGARAIVTINNLLPN